MQTLHPIIVHFPIALLITALGLDLLALLLKRPAIHRAALWNLGLGTLAAGVAVLTGLQAEEVAKHSFEIWKVMELHEKVGFTTLTLGTLITAWRLWRRDQLSTRARRVTTLAMIGLVGCVGFGGYLGGRLVYEFGVGGSFGVPQTSLRSTIP